MHYLIRTTTALLAVGLLMAAAAVFLPNTSFNANVVRKFLLAHFVGASLAQRLY
jgi:hypothetical protein